MQKNVVEMTLLDSPPQNKGVTARGIREPAGPHLLLLPVTQDLEQLIHRTVAHACHLSSLRVSNHGVGLARACLAVGKDARVHPVRCRQSQRFNLPFSRQCAKGYKERKRKNTSRKHEVKKEGYRRQTIGYLYTESVFASVLFRRWFPRQIEQNIRASSIELLRLLQSRPTPLEDSRKTGITYKCFLPGAFQANNGTDNISTTLTTTHSTTATRRHLQKRNARKKHNPDPPPPKTRPEHADKPAEKLPLGLSKDRTPCPA